MNNHNPITIIQVSPEQLQALVSKAVQEGVAKALHRQRGWMKLSQFNQETNQKWTSAKCSRLAAKGCGYVRQEEAGRAWRVNLEGYYKSLER